MTTLNDFLKTMLLPANGSRRGIHWHAGTGTNMSPQMLDEIDTIADMTKGGWVKIMGDGTADRLGNGPSQAELLLAFRSKGVVPIYRIWQTPDAKPNDGHRYAFDWLANHIGRGTQQIVVEPFNEPDLNDEWPDKHRPTDWLERVVANWIPWANLANEIGVIPAFPAMASGVFGNRDPNAAGKWDPATTNPYKWIAQAGVKRFCNTGHNYPSNHNWLDYPYDPVNQLGQALSDGEWAWPGAFVIPGVTPPDWLRNQILALAWGDRTRATIDAVRLAHKNTGDSIIDDDTAFLAPIVNRRLLIEAGFDYIPTVITETGPVHGILEDDRYARNTAAVLITNIAQMLQWSYLHPWLLCYCWWLYGQEMIGGTGGWQEDCWRTNRHNDLYQVSGYMPQVTWLRNRPIELDAQGFVEAEQYGIWVPRPSWTASDAWLGEVSVPSDDNGGTTVPDEQTYPPLAVENSAASYGVSIEPCAPEPGEWWWQAYRIQHLEPSENNGNHNWFFDVFDKDGNRGNGAKIQVTNADGSVTTAVIDKPIGEPGSNVPINKQDTLSATVTWDGLKADRVKGVHTRHPDEATGNTLYHHSFYTAWRCVQQPVEAEPEPEPGEFVVDETFVAWLRNEAINHPISTDAIPYNDEFAFDRYTRTVDEDGLGAPLCDEWRATYQGFTIAIKKYAEGICYTLDGRWDNIAHIAY